MVYLRKLLISMSYILMWTALYFIVYTYHTFFITHTQAASFQYENESGTPLMETIGLSSITNLLMGTLYMIGYALHATYTALCSVEVTQPPPAVRVYCSYQVRSETAAVHVTPSMLWYYVYSIGLGIFCLTYTLHGSHFISSLCLSVSCMVCSMWIIVKEVVVLHHLKKIILVFMAVSDCFTVLLCSYQLMITHQWEPKDLWRNWACECLGPLLAPWALAASRHKVRSIQIPSYQVVMFGLPFVGVLSTGFLSMYIPLQECSSSILVPSLNTTNTALMWGATLGKIFISHGNNTSSTSWLSFNDGDGTSTCLLYTSPSPRDS